MEYRIAVNNVYLPVFELTKFPEGVLTLVYTILIHLYTDCVLGKEPMLHARLQEAVIAPEVHHTDNGLFEVEVMLLAHALIALRDNAGSGLELGVGDFLYTWQLHIL